MKWRFIIVQEDYELLGTNDEAVAWRATEWAPVYDAQDGVWVRLEPNDELEPIEEWVEPDESKDEDNGPDIKGEDNASS